VKISVPADTSAKSVKVKFMTTKIEIGVGGQTRLSGTLAGTIVPDECTWTLDGKGSGRIIWATLTKNKDATWPDLFAVEN